MYKIYCLIDPTTNQPFYVGATKLTLDQRLSAHLSNSRTLDYKTNFMGSIIYQRGLIIKTLVEKGFTPIISLITNANHENVDELERFHYQKLISEGAILVQSPHVFTYQGHYCRQDGKLIERKNQVENDLRR